MNTSQDKKRMNQLENVDSAATYWQYESDDENLDANNGMDFRVGQNIAADDLEEDQILEMDTEPSSSRSDAFDDSYQAKCGSHPRPSLRWRLCQVDDDQELSENDRKKVQAAIGSVRADHVQCNCLNTRCKIVRYLKTHHNKEVVRETCQMRRNDLNVTSHMTHSASRLQIAKDDFRRVHDQLISLSGGKDRATNVYHKICALAKGQTRVDCSSGTNTALMQLCSTTFKDESDPTRCEERMMLNAQIYALAKLYMDLDPEALFVHNSQDAGSLELAALTNKVVVSKYLSMLHTIYGRDVNAPNKRGHTLLHLLARKGDDCAETLEALLNINLVSQDGSRSHRLFRMDVLNEGKKTPLDVATACVDLFSTGKDRAIYSRVIAIFHNAIEEEARELELESNSQHQQLPQQLTFQNDF